MGMDKKIRVKRNKIEKNGKIGFIYSTYDDVSFLWPDFFRLIKQFWPDFDTYFDGYISMAERKKIVVSDKLTIKPVGLPNKGTTYSERLIECINRLNCEYVFVMIDDFYIKSPVDIERFNETYALIRKDKKLDAVTYENFRSGVTDETVELPYMRYLKKKMFLCNLQIGLWRASSLQKLARMNESPWLLEYYGSVRACVWNYKVLTIKKGLPPIFNYDFGWLLIRGKFDKKTYDNYVQTLGIDAQMGEQIGFYEHRPPRKVGKMEIAGHVLKAGFSLFRR